MIFKAKLLVDCCYNNNDLPSSTSYRLFLSPKDLGQYPVWKRENFNVPSLRMNYLFSPFLTTQFGIFVFVYVYPESVTTKRTRKVPVKRFTSFSKQLIFFSFFSEKEICHKLAVERLTLCILGVKWILFPFLSASVDLLYFLRVFWHKKYL